MEIPLRFMSYRPDRRFTEITSDSFDWLGEALEPNGKSWKLEGEFRARRMRIRR
jgi:hypothetical protein